MLFRIIYEDKASSFEKLLEKDSSVSIHARNLCVLAVKMFKVVKGLALTIINDLFHGSTPPPPFNYRGDLKFQTKIIGGT